MEYHSLLFEPRRCLTVNQWVIVSVSLRSIIHSYKEQVADADAELEFPSPYGVSFILIYNWLLWWLYVRWVSVSLRSYIHSYEIISSGDITAFSDVVSVSLRSYIHSYKMEFTRRNGWYIFVFPSPYGVSFILINNIVKKIQSTDQKFPSPCGVIFILTNGYQNFMICAEYIKFPSPYGVIFILMVE